MRLIDADALENVEIPVNGYWDESHQCYVYQPPTWVQAFEAINKAPTIDAVPVVRCRECRHGLYNEHYGNVVCSAHLWTRGPRYFCGDGERREDDNA